MKKISLIKYSPFEDQSLTPRLVQCYRDVFAGKPWNEWLRCPKCGKSWGIDAKDFLLSGNFKHCGISLIDFRTEDEIIFEIQREITADASCRLAIDQNKVIGFCWGFPIMLESMQGKLGQTLDTPNNIDQTTRIAYQSELGILPEYRHQGIAKKLVKQRLLDFLDQELEYGLVRVKQTPKPSVTYLWYTKLGYSIVGHHSNGRVILGRELDGLERLL